MNEGKMKYNKTRPLAILFGALVCGIGLSGIWAWWVGALEVLNNGDNGIFFIYFLIAAFTVIGPCISLGTYFSGIVYRRVDKIFLHELYSNTYDNGIMVAYKGEGRMFTDNAPMIAKRNYVKILNTYDYKGEHNWSILSD